MRSELRIFRFANIKILRFDRFGSNLESECVNLSDTSTNLESESWIFEVLRISNLEPESTKKVHTNPNLESDFKMWLKYESKIRGTNRKIRSSLAIYR